MRRSKVRLQSQHVAADWREAFLPATITGVHTLALLTVRGPLLPTIHICKQHATLWLQGTVLQMLVIGLRHVCLFSCAGGAITAMESLKVATIKRKQGESSRTEH